MEAEVWVFEEDHAEVEKQRRERERAKLLALALAHWAPLAARGCADRGCPRTGALVQQSGRQCLHIIEGETSYLFHLKKAPSSTAAAETESKDAAEICRNNTGTRERILNHLVPRRELGRPMRNGCDTAGKLWTT